MELRLCNHVGDKLIKKKIYIAENNPSIINLLSELFKSREKYEPHFFSDGLELYYAVRESPPDILMLGVILPSLSGYAIVKLLKFSSDVSYFPIFFLLGYLTPDIEKNIADIKVDAVIKVPFNEKDVFDLIERFAN